ncbi:MAG: hypothetical protein HN753_01190 [Methylococcales bacterium]|jgi:hypothetical protein|nr:hypothetical protein [Methylococcales bacterium]
MNYKEQCCKRYGLIIWTVLFSVLISACESKQESNTLLMGQGKVQQRFEGAYTLKGIVSNDEHPIKNGRVEATDLNGQVLATISLVDNARYRFDLPAGTAYPVILTAYPASGEEQLRVVVANPTPVNFDITSLTTAIAEKAKQMGGYTKKNLQRAAFEGVAMPDRDRTQAGFRGDPTKQFGGWH